jgi:actin related protein 2/3 complex subunit 2
MVCVCAVLFPRHFEGAKRDSTIDLIHTFRDYLHYHIKCSKAYLHQRMRARTSALLKVRAAASAASLCRILRRMANVWGCLIRIQVLNRARPEAEKKERKTVSGKTFVKK